MAETKATRCSLISKLILAAIFVALVAVASVLVIRSFLAQPEKTVVVLPKDLLPPGAATHPPANPPAQRAAPPLSGPAIGGLVVNESGKPVANAKINLNFWITNGPGQRLYHNAQARTDANGRWTSAEVPRPAFANLRFNVTQHNYATLSVPSALATDLLAQDAQFVMTRGLDLSGIIVNDAGLPLIGAKINVGRLNNNNAPTA